jgi:hypothetical protein
MLTRARSDKYLKLKILWIASLGINCFFIILFYYFGSADILRTILFYFTALLTGLVFIKRRILRINVLAVICILFSGELYLKITRKGPQSYTEIINASFFSPYVSPIFGEQNRLHYGYRINKPNSVFQYETVDFNYTHRYNEMGLREKPLSFFKGKKNVLILGDSFSEGVGAPADSTLSKSMEFYSDNDFRFINAGVRGSDIVYAYDLLDTLCLLTSPQLVIYNLNFSDINDVVLRGGDERFTAGYRKQYWWEYLYAISYISRTIMENLLNYNPNALTFEDFTYSIDVIMKKIIEFDQYCKMKNIKFLCLITPGIPELYGNAFDFEESFQELQKYTGIRYLNLKTGLTEAINRQYTDPYRFYHKKDEHLNADGYWISGRITAEYLKTDNSFN